VTHIGLNLVYLVPGETGGTETYARELIRALVDASSEHYFTAFVSREGAAASDAPWIDLVPSVEVPVSATNRLDWVRGEQLQLPRLAAGARVDLVHSLANTGPLRGHFRRVVTIHDLHHRLVPEAHLGVLGAGMRILVSGAARRSDRIITPSVSTAADVERLLRVNAAQLDVVPEGIGTEQRAAPQSEREIRGWLRAGERPIVLSVSAKRPHKNLARLIGAVAEIPRERRPLLVIPGYVTPYEQELQRHVGELGVGDDVRLIGWIEPEQLEGLYAAAACLVCASLHEGFGLPVLEAMARALPVACSTGGALSEVAGDAALLFDPHSVPQITAAIERLVSDRQEAERLRALGASRARAFSWAATAAGTLASYEAALRRNP
jgi:glycosyltransferase involved in cell wall biosynthesis